LKGNAVNSNDLTIVKLYQRVSLPDEIEQFHELPKLTKVIKIAGLLQNVYCHVRTEGECPPSAEVLAKSYLLKEYCEFFLARYTQEQTITALYLNFVRGAKGIEKCVEPSDWPTICRQEEIRQVFLMFLFLFIQNEYIDEIKI